MTSIKDKFNRWFIPGFMLVSSITLIVIGVPRFLHELMLVPGTPILHRVNAGETVSEQDLEVLENSRLDALGIIELPDAYLDLGSSYLYRARSAADPEEAQKYAALTIEVSEKGLKMAPLNTFAWFRVATANVMLGNFPEGLNTWRTSIATARFEPFILIQRVHLGVILYQDMTDEDVDLLKDQLGMAYRWDRQKLRQYVRDNDLILWMAILSEPDSEMKEYLVG
ncbi:hypothetical protein ACFO5Q_02690 [Kordiimonas lipolytica]|uniref:Uncharacterized protein n=1 Tax=Kordiimonas lipolytica TaxID=1662421 RepID=A0ABV8U7L8_9PROT|nr:hypothetical protein [Kordiimonas lipolytica]